MDKEGSLMTKERTDDIRCASILGKPRISEASIRKELEEDGLLAPKKIRTRPVAFYTSWKDQRNNEHVDSLKKPPRILEKLKRTSKQNFSLQALTEKMKAADQLHREKLQERGKSARTYEDRYDKMRKARAQEDEDKRKRIEEKHKRAEELRKKREMEIAVSKSRMLKIQDTSEIPQNRILQKYDQKRKKGGKKKNKVQKLKRTNKNAHDALRQKIEDIERRVNPVELLLNSEEICDLNSLRI